MEKIYNIAGYCRISVDEELDRDNTSIENQKMIIKDFVERHFPSSTLIFYEDRDRSGYTFEQRESYQKLRPLLINHDIDILIIKDFSRFSRRNSKGLVELEDLRDAGVRIISIGDGIDFPTDDDWTAIQFRFLINEMPVTDTSKKVKSVIKRRQSEGKWICSVPYGYVITNSKTMSFTVDEPAAEIVGKIYELYIDGWGYKKIANYLTELNIPTPRAVEKERKEAKGEEYKHAVKNEWSIITIQTILENDFYIGTLRQGKYKRKNINGKDIKNDEAEHIVFEKNHAGIIDDKIFAKAQELKLQRSTSHYRGVKKYDNFYSGVLFCGDCGSPMFSMSRPDLAPAYTCGTYHKRGTKGCTSHHIRCDMLDDILKSYICKVRDNCSNMLDKLEQSLKSEKDCLKSSDDIIETMKNQIDAAKAELKFTEQQRIREIMRNPDREDIISETYTEMVDDLVLKIAGLENQLTMAADKRNTMVQVNRRAKTVIEIFDDIINKEKLDKYDINLIVERIDIFDDLHIDVRLKSDIDSLLKCGSFGEKELNFPDGTIEENQCRLVLKTPNRRDKVYSVNVVSGVDTPRLSFLFIFPLPS